MMVNAIMYNYAMNYACPVRCLQMHTCMCFHLMSACIWALHPTHSHLLLHALLDGPRPASHMLDLHAHRFLPQQCRSGVGEGRAAVAAHPWLLASGRLLQVDQTEVCVMCVVTPQTMEHGSMEAWKHGLRGLATSGHVWPRLATLVSGPDGGQAGDSTQACETSCCNMQLSAQPADAAPPLRTTPLRTTRIGRPEPK